MVEASADAKLGLVEVTNAEGTGGYFAVGVPPEEVADVKALFEAAVTVGAVRLQHVYPGNGIPFEDLPPGTLQQGGNEEADPQELFGPFDDAPIVAPPTLRADLKTATPWQWRCRDCGRIVAELNFVPPAGGIIDARCKCGHTNRLEGRADGAALNERGNVVAQAVALRNGASGM